MKNNAMLGSHLTMGIALGLRKKGGWEAEKWVGQVNEAVTTN